MAYNVSVIQQDFDDRWRWIHKGIETLLQAIRLQPNDPILYREIGWIYQHKLADQMDTANLHYKYRLAAENHKLFGKKHHPDWEKLSKAPATKEEFLKRFPETPRAPLWNKPNGFSNYEKLLKSFEETGNLPEALKEQMGEREFNDCELALRRILIRKNLNIDPDVAMRLEQKFGEFDWLVPDTLALYWGFLGNEKTYLHNNLECERILTQSLKRSFLVGRIVFPNDVPGKAYLLLPNLDLVEKAADEFSKEYIMRDTKFNMGYETFLKQVIDTFYLYGRKKEAEKYFKILQDGKRVPEIKGLTLDQFAEKRLREMIKSGTWFEAMRTVQSFVTQSAYALANGEQETARQRLATAEQIYELYRRRNDDDEAERTRLSLPPFAEIKRQITQELIRAVPSLAPALRAELELQGTPNAAGK